VSAIVIRPIGVVRSTRAAPTDDGWDAETARIELDTARFGAEALLGLDAFSHVEVVFVFHRVDEAGVCTGARHPRDDASLPLLGIFAQRGKDRPNRIGLTVCRLLRIEGTVLHVAGLDAIDGTPVLDLKPWMSVFAPRGEVREPAWSVERMRGYW
jgi:tRNA-Thr(GGU) m(6)t(6)A37 methyltransferase TsaA